jgi:vitamin B12 transporter
MHKHHGLSPKACAVLLFCLGLSIFLIFQSPALAISLREELEILDMYYDAKDLVVETPTREKKPLSQTAENVTVITAEEIQAINAHTLTDVLYHVPGVQINLRGGPGSVNMPFIQGSDLRHVLVMIDGVEMNNLLSFGVDIGAMTVQNIEKIEIIKGPASSAWGSSLGGVINIITKESKGSMPLRGELSGSYGEANTGDFRAEASGLLNNMDYYLNYTKLRTDGLTANTPHDSDHLYAKVRWQLTDRANLLLTLGYSDGDVGEGEYPAYDLIFHNNFYNIFSTLAFEAGLWEGADLSLSIRTREDKFAAMDYQKSTGTEVQRVISYEDNYGGSAKLSWKKDIHSLVAGVDFDNGLLTSNVFTEGNSHTLEKYAFFANDTLQFGQFTLTPGFRYDHTSTNGSFLSPSVGLTYQPWERLLFRSYIARGFNIPGLFDTFGTGGFSLANPSLGMEKVWSYQVGAETTAVPFFWLKAGLFRHDIRDALAVETISETQFTWVNKGRQRRQGFEAEAKTVSFWDTSLFGGFVLTDVKDRDTMSYIEATPRYTADIGLQYDDRKTFLGTLMGHYVWWNPHRSLKGNYDSIIWDLHLSKKVYQRTLTSVEVFLSGRNLFNSSQYLYEIFKNPGRWVEGGVRVKF